MTRAFCKLGIPLAILAVASFLGMPQSKAGQNVLKDDVFEMVEVADKQYDVVYKWQDPAIVFELNVNEGDIVEPGYRLATLKVKQKDHPARSDAHIRAGATYRVKKINIQVGKHIIPNDDNSLFVLERMLLTHDSTTAVAARDLEMRSLFRNLWHSTGIRAFIYLTGSDWSLGLGRLMMIAVGLILLYLAIVHKFEPLLLVPIGFGSIMVNIPLAGLDSPDGILGMLAEIGIDTGLFPLLIFMGVGAMTDFGPLIANPLTALLGAAAQFGIFSALLGALVLTAWIPGIEFSLADAASIGIIGGADGPTSIFLAGRLSPALLGAIAVAAYSYMALVPIIQPPIMRMFTTPEERRTKMKQLRHVSQLEKIFFPLGIVLLSAFLIPDAAPLISMLMFGNLLKECGVVNRLSDTAQNALINIVTIFLGLAVGSKLGADKFLNMQTLGIVVLGLVAFAIGTMTGVLFGKIMYRLSGKTINPLIGAAGVSAVPMAARVVNRVGLEEDHHNFLLMHAMGPNVAGVIGSAVAAGLLLNALG